LLSPDVQKIITDCAREFDVRVVWLFGSSLDNPAEARDIDLAVEGLAPERFFKFYGKLFDQLPKPVDIVDLSQEPPLEPIIRARGIRIYER
ncbi:MAG: nucleotidyltransferase domain-containing protein, partial [Candidatus Sumerlaeota bacterium]|nr:nucleotidyltransferase domain-containing protein [Candidatus Sumerlaeota bacterium]